jgi:hypothetical protein
MVTGYVMAVRNALIRGALAAWVLSFPLAVVAQQAPAHGVLPDFDKRLEGKGARVSLPFERRAAVEALGGRVPQLAVDWDPIICSPKAIYSRSGFLSGPTGEGGALSPERIRQLPASDPHRAIKAFLEEHRALLGYGKSAIDRARLKRESVAPHNGMRTVVWQQERDGIELYETVLVGHVSREGELISLAAQFVPQLDEVLPPRPGQPLRPRLSSKEALLIAGPLVGEDITPESVMALEEKGVGAAQRQRFRAAPLPGEAEVQLMWLPLHERQVNLCWQVELTRRAGGERFRLLIDAETGEPLLRRCLTVYLSPAEYRVFTSDSPAPFTPGHSFPSTNQAPLVARSLVSWPALSRTASPTGWIHEAENETRGNNVEAHLDRDGNNEPDLPRPQGSPARVFDFPLDLSQPPSAYGDAAVVQFFYWCNWMHDRLYELGFNEAAGNFQKDNFGRGGLGNDPIVADAQDGSGVNNANYSPTPDGTPARIQMFLFDGPDPDRDGSLDAEIILHEYTHGLTDRMVGGGAGLTSLQSIGLAEGWSDFYALAVLSESSDDPHGVYPTGGYSTYLYKGLKENYYFGIRRYPYSTDLTKNPLTFKDIDPDQVSAHAGVPRSPVYNFDPKKAGEVHAQGEVWCAVLWEARANLIDKHGFETGNQLALQLVTDGLKLSPPNPTFLQARDAILLADRVDTGGENQFELWTAFAKRGMGVKASGPPNWGTQGVAEAYDLPDLLTVTPYTAQVFTGPAGGPVQPPCRLFTLSNPSETALDWAAGGTQPWLVVEPTRGVIPPGGSTNLSVCLSAQALLLPIGVHSDVLTISNLNTGALLFRTVQIRILQIAAMPFFEDFESGQFQPYWTVSGEGFPRALVI